MSCFKLELEIFYKILITRIHKEIQQFQIKTQPVPVYHLILQTANNI